MAAPKARLRKKALGRGAASVPVRADRGHAGTEARRCANTEGEHAQRHAFQALAAKRDGKDRGVNRWSDVEARGRAVTTSPRPRRVAHSLGAAARKAKPGRRAGRLCAAKAHAHRSSAGADKPAFIGQRKDAVRGDEKA